MENKEMTQKRKITRQSGEFAYQKYLELKGEPIYRSSTWNLSPGAFKPLSQGPMKTSCVFIRHTIKVCVSCY